MNTYVYQLTIEERVRASNPISKVVTWRSYFSTEEACSLTGIANDTQFTIDGNHVHIHKAEPWWYQRPLCLRPGIFSREFSSFYTWKLEAFDFTLKCSIKPNTMFSSRAMAQGATQGHWLKGPGRAGPMSLVGARHADGDCSWPSCSLSWQSSEQQARSCSVALRPLRQLTISL